VEAQQTETEFPKPAQSSTTKLYGKAVGRKTQNTGRAETKHRTAMQSASPLSKQAKN
jgi:hypothetical protein